MDHKEDLDSQDPLTDLMKTPWSKSPHRYSKVMWLLYAKNIGDGGFTTESIDGISASDQLEVPS